MAKADVIPEHALRPKNNHVMFLLMGLASFAYIFDLIVSLSVPAAAIAEAPVFFQHIFVYFRNPVFLLVIYLCSMIELFALSRAYPFLKNLVRTTV